MKGTGEFLLYVDFDGVLHHQNCLWHPLVGAYLSAPTGYVLFQHAELLEHLLAPYPAVRIILSTTWVVRYGCVQSAKNLRPALRSRVIGSTFNGRMSREDFDSKSRGEQVWADVQKRKPKGWLALDDVYEGWPTAALPHYVRTHKWEGISDPEVLAELKGKLWETFTSEQQQAEMSTVRAATPPPPAGMLTLKPEQH